MAIVDVSLLLRAKDEASGVLQKVGAAAEGVGKTMTNAFQTGGLAATAALGAIGAVGAAAIKIGSDFQQAGIAFETMLGSADVAKKTLGDLAKFAKSTPFEFPQLLDASKRLLAYGMEADNLIPTLKNLGDIAAGVGMEKLPQLVLAFGQVKAATKLTGMELRQFSEAGVPLLEALVKQANAAGGVLTKVGGISKSAASKMNSLTERLVDQEFRFKLLTDAGKQNTMGFKTLTHEMDQTKAKLGEFGKAGAEHFVRVKTTAQEMIEKISDGDVKFEDVQKALAGMTAEGGKFFNLMEKQADTFSGRMSNIRDSITFLLADIVGVSIQEGGKVREGSLFDVMSKGAKVLLDGLTVLQPKIVEITTFITQNQIALGAVAGAILGLLVVAIGAFIVAFGAAIATAAAFAAVFAVIGAAIVAFVTHFDEAKAFILTKFDEIKLGIEEKLLLIHNGWDAFWSQDLPFLLGKGLRMIMETLIKWGVELFVWWNTLPQQIAQAVMDNWPQITAAVSSIASAMGNVWMENLNKMIDAIRTFPERAKNALVSNFKGNLDATKSFLSGLLNLQGFATGGVVPGPLGEPRAIIAHGGEEVSPPSRQMGSSIGGNSGVNFNVHIGLYAGSAIEKREIARELYKELTVLASAENKTVQQLFGR